MEKTNYIKINVRGTKMCMGKDLLCELPYIKGLLKSPMQNNERDDDGMLIIDEDPGILCCVIDRYREWLQLGCPEAFEDKTPRRGLSVAFAQRMGFEEEFVEALSANFVKKYTQADLFRCFYCNGVFARNETSVQKECRYHNKDCECKFIRATCTRLPFHSEVALDIATPPKKI
jgi:hypothetical protein